MSDAHILIKPLLFGGVSFLFVVIYPKLFNFIHGKKMQKIVVESKQNGTYIDNPNKTIAHLSDYHAMKFTLPEDEYLEHYIKKCINSLKLDFDNGYLPKKYLIRKKFLLILFILLIFIYISLIFFHFPIYTYLIGIIILFIYRSNFKKYSIFRYFIKQVKARPSEKIKNILFSEHASATKDNCKNIKKIGIIFVTVLTMVLFFKPRIIYEKIDGGYAVRYYIAGITNFVSVNIPSEYKGENVVSLRGNAFSNMFFLNKATLSDTIKEIRGETFKNDFLLREVKLPNMLQEIKGDMFRNCYSLKEIVIPDSVTRIGGHAFYNCRSLTKVELTYESQLKEIGSSAFRNCSSLKEITIPERTAINARAFKNSNTNVIRFSTPAPYNLNFYNTSHYIYFELNSEFDIDSRFLVKLIKINEVSNNFEYILTITGSVDASVILSAKNNYYLVNDDLLIKVIKIEGNDGIGVAFYYNKK